MKKVYLIIVVNNICNNDIIFVKVYSTERRRNIALDELTELGDARFTYFPYDREVIK